MLESNFTNQFIKDVKLLQKRRMDIDALFDILIKIIWEQLLLYYSREHNLSGDYSGYTECHVKAALSFTSFHSIITT
jgi:mRNA interferase YafQ